MKPRLSVFWTCFCLTAILLVVFYAPSIIFNRDFFVSDHSLYFEPFARYIAMSYQQGHLPLWNPYCYCGMPQLANPSPGIFYFPNLLFVGLSYSKAMGWILLFHQLVAFCGAYLLIESLGWGVLAAAFCGVLMSFNGYMTSLSSNYTLPGTAAWGIVAIYGLINIGRPTFRRAAHKYGFVALTAACVHWMIMCGRPEVFVPMMALLGAGPVFILLGWLSPFVVAGARKKIVEKKPDEDLSAELVGEAKKPDEDLSAELVGEEKKTDENPSADLVAEEKIVDENASVTVNWRGRAYIFAWQMAAIILGILLSCPELLPVYEWSKLSPRASGLSLENVFKWSANWYDLMSMVCPQPLGDLQLQSAKYLTWVATHKNHYPFLPSALVGPVVFSLAWLGLFDRSYKNRLQVLAGFLVALLFALGKNGLLSEHVLKLVPFLMVLRYPCKLLIVVILFVAVLASRGMYVVVQDKVKNWQKKFLLTLWLVLLAVALAMVLADTHCAYYLGKLPPPMVHLLGSSLAVTSASGLVVALLILFAGRLKLKPALLACLLIILMGESIFVPAMKFAPRMVAPGYFTRPQTLAVLRDKYLSEKDMSQNSRLGVVYFDPLKVADGYKPRYPLLEGEPFMQYAREMLLPNTNVDSRVRGMFGYEASENKDFRTVYIKCLNLSHTDIDEATDVELARFCLVTGTRFLATQAENFKGEVNALNPKYFKLLNEDVTMNVRLYEIITRKPRAFFAPAYRTIASQDDAINEIYAAEHEENGPTGSAFDKCALVELDQKTDVTSDPLNFNDYSQSKATALLSGVATEHPTFSKEMVTSITSPQMAAPEVTFLRDEGERVSISLKCPVAGFVILNDRFYPGWHAVVDTQPAPIYRANAFMRAVYLSKGAHLIEFSYEPESLRNGLYLALIALTVIAVLLALLLKEPSWSLVRYMSSGQKGS